MNRLSLLLFPSLLLMGCNQKVRVLSEPSGAEIFLDGQPTEFKTRADLVVSQKNRVQMLELRLAGFESYGRPVEYLGKSKNLTLCSIPWGCCGLIWIGPGDHPVPDPSFVSSKVTSCFEWGLDRSMTTQATTIDPTFWAKLVPKKQLPEEPKR